MSRCAQSRRSAREYVLGSGLFSPTFSGLRGHSCECCACSHYLLRRFRSNVYTFGDSYAVICGKGVDPMQSVVYRTPHYAAYICPTAYAYTCVFSLSQQPPHSLGIYAFTLLNIMPKSLASAIIALAGWRELDAQITALLQS